MKLPAVEHVIVWTICLLAFMLGGMICYCEISGHASSEPSRLLASSVVGSLVTLLVNPKPAPIPTTQETVTTTATSTTPP